MPRDLALLDTNVLVYALYGDSPFHPAASSLINQAQQPDAGFCITQQILAEFYSVVTNPRRVTSPQPPETALEAIDALLALPGLTLLPPPLHVISRWMALLRQHPVTGHKVFDVLLAATMLAAGIKQIYTFNAPDFAPFRELHVMIPQYP
jgi:hypothetical protein